MQTHKLLLAIGTGALVASGASAAVVSATVADVSSEFSALQGADNTVNGSGLDTSNANPLLWTHDNGFPDGGGSGFFWHSIIHDNTNSADDVFITYDLGSVVDLNSVLIWNFNAVFTGGDETLRSFNQYDLSVSADNVTFTEIVTDGTLNQAGGTTTEGVQVVNVAGSANGVRYVRIDADSNFGGVVTGLSEVRFDVVPEPGSLALLGLGGLALLRRRR
ncbi:discoidin domain-containing protein [Phycisphaeraceae bacterium D3-23]